AEAAYRSAAARVGESQLTGDEELSRWRGDKLDQLLLPQCAASEERRLETADMAASTGAAGGEVVLESAQALERNEAGAHVILVRRETQPGDLRGMIVADGILAARGGKTSHAAVVA
ncbi:pyruvate, phosphate dikinase, partial [Cellulomonas humilata]